MSTFLSAGLIGGAVCVLMYALLAIRAKRSPLLNDALTLFICSISIAGGIRVCQYVVTGRLVETFKVAAECRKGEPLFSEDDTIYFLFGGFALIWVSAETVVRLLLTSYRAAFQ